MSAIIWLVSVSSMLGTSDVHWPAAAADAYPRPELLVEAETLAKNAKPYLILDVRPKAEFEKGHIAGAYWVDASQWTKEFAKEPKAFAHRLRTAIAKSQRQRFVIYDDVKSRDAARLWWILRYSGHENASLLNGGWKNWQSLQLPIETGISSANIWAEWSIERDSTGSNTLVQSAQRLATMQQLLQTLKNPGVSQIIDARSENEYCGSAGMAKRKGSIPGAIHLEWSDLIDAQTHKFKSSQELTELFKKAGIKLDQPLVTYCQSGGRASVMAFGLELMGAKQVQNYYASWAEWGNQTDTPIDQPKPKKPAADR